MATANRFSIFPCSFIHAGGTLNLAQMQGFGVEPGSATKRVFVGGAVDPKANLLASANPRLPFQTRDLTTLIGTVSPLTGLALTGAGATFRIQERDEAEAFFLTGGTHETYTVAKGHLVIDSISASQDDQDGAVAQCILFALHNGSVLPIVHNTGVDLAGAPAPAFTSEFFMGPVYHNGVELTGILSQQVQFGLAFRQFRTSGAVYPSQGYIARREPVIRLTTLKADMNATVSHFLRATSGALACYFWKAADASDRVAVGTTVHLKITAATGAFSDDTFSVTENDDGTLTLNILPTGALAYSISSAIP